MSMMKQRLEEIIYKYIEEHPNLSWEEAAAIVCEEAENLIGKGGYIDENTK